MGREEFQTSCPERGKGELKPTRLAATTTSADQQINRLTHGDDYRGTNDDNDDYYFEQEKWKEEDEEEEEQREIQEAERDQLRIEFATNIIAAHKYCLRNVIRSGKGFDCEILYLPRYKNPNDNSDTFFTRIFKLRMLESEDPRIDCTEIRSSWGGTGELKLGPTYISDQQGEELTNRALSIAASLLQIPENEEEQERFFAELLTREEYDTDNTSDEVARQQEHGHELDIVIAELCADVETAFFEPRMWGG